MPKKTPFHLIERISAALRSEAWQIGREHGLQPIQLQMLDYLGRCNRYSDTPASVAAYFQLTKGTVTQSLKALERKGYLTKETDEKDRRKVHLHLTEAGQLLVDTVLPSTLIAEAQFSAAEHDYLTALLSQYLQSLQQANQFHTFGICQSCHHFLQEGEGEYRCGLTREVLTPADIDLICIEHDS